MARIILVILIFGMSNNLCGQDHRLPIKQLLDSAKSIWYVDFDKTDQLLTRAEKLLKSPDAGNVADLFKVYELRAGSCQAFSRLQLWREYIAIVDSLLIQHKPILGADFKRVTLPHEISRAQYYFQINDEIKALEIFSQLQSEHKKLPESLEACERLSIINNDISNIHRRRGEYEASINQLLSSLRYYDCSDRLLDEPKSRVVIYRNIGATYLEKGDYANAGKYLRLAEQVLVEFLKKNPLIVSRAGLSLYETQASYYIQVKQNDSALFAMRKAAHLLGFQNIDSEFKGRINESLAKLYLLEGNFNEAEKHFDQAEVFFLNSQGRQSFYLAGIYLSKADFFEKQTKYDQALNFCNQAIGKLVLNFKPDMNGNPNLKNVLSKKQLFSVLQKKAQLHEKISVLKNDLGALVKAFNTNHLALALLDSTANEFSLDKDKIILSEQSYAAFEDAIRISNTLYKKANEEKYFNNVIALIEKSKGNLLLENLRLVNRFSGIKQEWLNQEKELKAEMLLVEQSIYQAEEKSEGKAELQKSRERYAAIKREYSALIEQIKREAPDYYKLRFDHSVVSGEMIQQQLLKSNEALIEFFVGDSILAIAGFAKDKKYLKVKPLLPDFTAKMNQFRGALTTMNSDFSELSTQFYDFLLKDCMNELGADIKSLIIIPDGLLGYLPFEVLIQSKEPKTVYLNDQISIHYANSATYLMEQMNRKPSDAQNFFAGFVSSGTVLIPDEVVTRDQQYVSLQGAEKEVASITDLFSSGFMVFDPANKNDFIEKASDYKILHFAMHSSLNDKNPMMSVMVFSEADSTENLLSAIELYSMKLNSELAVLSACNTGVGQLHRGEGIMSFSRAFAYAGVPSAVISLWKVPDIATSKIMVSFYTYLKNGESKDKALQLARQDFIRENPEMAHPYYWSGFILSGNADSITFPTSRWWMWTLLASAWVVLLTIYLRRKKLKSV
jgi:CHAT domain-containing protein